MTMEPIAIVGKGCVLPTGLGSLSLWETVRAADICIREAPKNRWGLHTQNFVCDPNQPKSEYAVNSKGGYVPNRYHPVQTELDAVFTWTQEASKQALRTVSKFTPQRTGLVLGNLSFPTVKMNQFTEWCIGKKERN